MRNKDWAYIQYAEDASKGIELFNMNKDPLQYQNLAGRAKYADLVQRFKDELKQKLAEVRDNDL